MDQVPQRLVADPRWGVEQREPVDHGDHPFPLVDRRVYRALPQNPLTREEPDSRDGERRES
jgi:hypothetical protein